LTRLEIERTSNGVVLRQIDVHQGYKKEQTQVYEVEGEDGKVQADKVIDFIQNVLYRLRIPEDGVVITKANG
jgi:hypothetical protein